MDVLFGLEFTPFITSYTVTCFKKCFFFEGPFIVGPYQELIHLFFSLFSVIFGPTLTTNPLDIDLVFLCVLLS